jgi:DNA gyrase/topoisomerase IV subunit B
MATTYDSSNIKNLQFPDSVRAKPGMYIGATDSGGVLSITRELLDNSVDEALAGRCDTCGVYLEKDGTVWTYDDGAGIPAGTTIITNPADQSKTKVPTLRAVFGVLHTSGKFNDEAYATSRGCFAGGTKIELVDGRTLTMRQLYNEHKRGVQNYVWTACRRTGELRAQIIEQVHLTARTRKLVRVTLNTGDQFYCTPDHPLYQTSLKKVEAEDSLGRSLLSADFSYDKDGYRLGSIGDGPKCRLNRVVAEYYGQEITDRHVHHVNHDIVDNEPHNLESLTPAEHYAEHPNKLEIWMEYVTRTGHEKAKLLDRRNRKSWYKKLILQGKILKVACRILHAGLVVNRETYTGYMFHSCPNWKKAVRWFDRGAPELRASAKQVLAKAEYEASRGRSSGINFLEAISSYQIGYSEKSVVNQHDVEMVAKRVLGRALKSLVRVPNEGLSLDEYNACFRSSSISGRALCQYIDLDEFSSAVRNQVDPLGFLYSDLSEAAMLSRKNMYDRELARQRSSDWDNATTGRVYNKFMRELNAMIADGEEICQPVYHERFKNAFGNSSWYFGIEASKLRGHASKDEVIAAAAEFNHKVVSVERVTLEEPVPVFDLTVPVDHNYRLDCGVFVGNTHGIGAKATNALSTEFEVWTFNSGKWWHVMFKKGLLVKEVNNPPRPPMNPATGKVMRKGTLIRFIPDKSIFSSVHMPRLELFQWARMSAYLTPGLVINLVDGKANPVKTRTLSYPGGVTQYLDDRLDELRKKSEFGVMDGPAFTTTSNPLYDCALRFTSVDGFEVHAYTNGLLNAEGGNHQTSMLNALKESLQPYAGKKQEFTLHELKDGLIGLINVKLSSPKFDSQTKEKLVDERALLPVKEALLKEFTEFFKKNKKLAASIVERASKLRQLKTKFVASKAMLTKLRKISAKGLPAKGATAPKCKPEDRELYLLEGDCFLPGTMIHTAEGDRAIETLTQPFVGAAFDPETGTYPHVLMSASFTRKTVTEVIDVEFEDGHVVTCTPEHEWLTVNRGYVQAQHLTSEDLLLGFHS